jgi:hypothetical protein
MRRAVLAALLVLPLGAQATLFREDTALPPTLDIHVQAGFPQEVAGRDLDRGSWGASVAWLWHLGGRHLLRPNLEYDRYRVSPLAAPAWSPETDTSGTLRTWKLGVDYLLYQEPWVFRGPYVLVGIGIQYAEVDRWAQGGSQEGLLNSHETLTVPWTGVGAGYQITSDIALELRYSWAAYPAQRGQPLGSQVSTEPIQREGRYLHVALALRVPL